MPQARENELSLMSHTCHSCEIHIQKCDSLKKLLQMMEDTCSSKTVDLTVAHNAIHDLENNCAQLIREMAEKDDKLQVRMESYGSFDKSIKNKVSPENIDNDDYTYESTADYSQELKYSEELSSSILYGRLSSLELNESYDDHPKSPTTPIQRSLPSSATLQQPVRNYEKGEWKRPITVSRADEKTKLLQRQHLTEIRKKNHNYTDMKWNRTYNGNENNELVVPIRVADTMPIMNNTNKQILVKKNSRGGGDVLGGSRGRSRGKLHTFSFLTENSSLLTEGFI
jgi:hypothetical protein